MFVTDTVDENYEVVRAIDKDVLMLEIFCKVVNSKEDRYKYMSETLNSIKMKIIR